MTKENSIKQPEKKETLAKKQEARIRRIHYLRSRLPEFPSKWWVGVGELLGLTGLFLVNFWLLLPFFGYRDQHNAFSAPVVPVLTSLTEKWISFDYGVRVWLLVFLIFFPLSFYYFVREITNRRLIAFIACAFVILPAWFFLRIRAELGLMGEDGAQIASLTLIPLVSLLLLRFLRKGSFWAGILAGFGAALIALISPLGAVVLSIFMGVITFSEMLLGRGRLKLIRFFVVFGLTIGFATFWYNPKFVILTIQSSQGQVVTKTLSTLLPISFFLLPVLGVFGFLLFENRPQFQPMFIAFFLTVGFGLFSLGAGIAHPAPSRFLPAFGLSFAFLLGVLMVWLFDFLLISPKLKRFKIPRFSRRIMASGLTGLIFILLLMIVFLSCQSFWELRQTQVLGLTDEHEVGIWEIKEKTTQIENIFGYMITFLTVLGAGALRLRLRG